MPGGPAFVALKLGGGGMGCLALGALCGWFFNQPPTRLTFVSVGQGDCAVLQTEGLTVLIDAGPKTDRFDAGRRIVLPKLRRLGADSVDVIFLTHPDTDHVGGTASLLSAYPGAKLAISHQFREDPALLEILGGWGIPPDDILWLPEAARAQIGRFVLTVRAPAYAGLGNDNDGSLFMLMKSGPASAVLSGDAGQEVENLEATLEDWSAQVMKVGHHGSRTSTGSQWIAEVNPRYAVISCGRDNAYGHPAPEVVGRLNSAGLKVFRTDLQGDVRFDFDERLGFVPARG